MKKLVFMFAAIVAVSFASCGGNTKNAECADSTACDSTKVCTEVCDSAKACCADSTACDSTKACCEDSVKA